MRVPADELLVETVGHVLDGELAGVGGYLRVEKHLFKHVAELLAEVRDVVCLDGVNGLVGLLDHVLGDGAVGLLTVPGAAVGLAQPPDGADEPVHLGVARRCLRARRVLLVYQVRQGTTIVKPALRLVKLARHELHLLPFQRFSAVIVSRGLRTFRLRATPPAVRAH